MELLSVKLNSVIVEIELEEMGTLAHLREAPESNDATTRCALDFLATVRWVAVLWGRLPPHERQEALADAQALGWSATTTRGTLEVAP